MRSLMILFAAACAMLLAASSATAQQASITLTNCDANYCYTHNNLWSLSKTVTGNTVEENSGTITWTVSAVKSSGPTTFTVHGGLTVKNTGSAPATIGNIVVNLQKPNSPKKGSNASHVSIAANVANSTAGDAAISAKIVAGGSQENASTNALWGTNNYSVAGAVGTFTETAGSGSLEFTDASNNTVFSLVPQPTIPVGGSVTLLYAATFSTSVLPAAGTQMRVEAIVTFGNAGQRGGGGATTTNVDINGNGNNTDPGEGNVRSVPCRVSLPALPAAPAECNNVVMVTDAGPTTSGSVTASNPMGFDQFPAFVSESTSWDVSTFIDVAPGTGEVCNLATLDGVSCGGTLNVIVGYNPDLTPIFATYVCAEAAFAAAEACVSYEADPTGIQDGDFCTFSQGGYGGSGEPFNILSGSFATVFPSGVEVGIPGAGGFSMKFTSAAAVQAYLPAGGGANPLTADSVNPTSTSSGQFGGQVLALKLNVALSDAAVTPAGFGDLYYCDPTSSLHGSKVRDILAIAETAIGGGGLPIGYSYSTLAGLCANLDLSFDLKNTTFPTCGVATEWAKDYLSKVPCN